MSKTINYDNIKNNAIAELLNYRSFADFTEEDEREIMKYRLDGLKTTIKLIEEDLARFENLIKDTK